MVNPACTTQACSTYGFIPERKITLDIREHRSENCGLVIDRDTMQNESGTGSCGGHPLITLDEEMVFQFKSRLIYSADFDIVVLLSIELSSANSRADYIASTLMNP